MSRPELFRAARRVERVSETEETARAHLVPGGRLAVEIGHNRPALERACPRLPFRWPATSSGPGPVFVLPRQALPPPA